MRIIDLSTPLYTGMKVFPGDPEVKIKVVHTYNKNTWELRQFSMGSHTGTQVYAYSHMDKETLDDISIERFFGQAQVVDDSIDWPKETGLFFIEEVGLEVFNRIIGLNLEFVGGNIRKELERAVLGERIITYTGLINLELIPKGEIFMFYGLPLKIKSGDESPVRAITILEEK